MCFVAKEYIITDTYTGCKDIVITGNLSNDQYVAVKLKQTPKLLTQPVNK